MRLIKQQGGDAGKLGIIDQPVHEDRLGHDENAGAGRGLAVEAGHVAHGLSASLSQHLRHALGRSAGGDAAGRGEDDLAGAPRLAQQIGATAVVLPAPGGADQHACALARQCGADLRQDSDDGKVGVHRPAR